LIPHPLAAVSFILVSGKRKRNLGKDCKPNETDKQLPVICILRNGTGDVIIFCDQGVAAPV